MAVPTSTRNPFAVASEMEQAGMKTLRHREVILAAAKNDRALLLEGIKRLFNCEEADVDNEGDAWIIKEHRGRWLDADDLARIASALRAGEI
jgi:hypothetical protein